MANFNLLETLGFEHGHPHVSHEEQRTHSPVCHHLGSAKLQPCWTLTHYQDIRIKLVDSVRFTRWADFGSLPTIEAPWFLKLVEHIVTSQPKKTADGARLYANWLGD